METVIDSRLASFARRQIGKVYGEGWAARDADIEQLLRLGAFWHGTRGTVLRDYLTTRPDESLTAADRFAQVVTGDDETPPRLFWETLLELGYGESLDDFANDEFVQGFAEGAIEHYDTIRDEL